MKKTLLAILFLSSLMIAEQGSGNMQGGMGHGMGSGKGQAMGQGMGQGMGRSMGQGMGRGGNKEAFEARKTKILAFMEENYNSRVTCVKAAKNREDMQQCRKQAMEKMKEQREKFRARRMQNK